MATSPEPEREALLSIRSALILLITVVVGVAAGILSSMAGQGAATGVLVGGAAAGSALTLFHKVLER